MSETFLLEIVSPERKLVSEEVTRVYLPGSEGDMEIFPEHSSLLTDLRVGELFYRPVDGNEDTFITLSGGFAQVLSDSVTILAFEASFAEEIDLEAMLERKIQLELQLQDTGKDFSKKVTNLQAQLMRTLLNIDVANRIKSGKR